MYSPIRKNFTKNPPNAMLILLPKHQSKHQSYPTSLSTILKIAEPTQLLLDSRSHLTAD